VILLLN